MIVVIDIVLLVLWTAIYPIKAKDRMHYFPGIGEVYLNECHQAGTGIFNVLLIAIKVPSPSSIMFINSNLLLLVGMFNLGWLLLQLSCS